MPKNAFVLGKFLPPHLGHKFLIDFAASYPYVKQVDVLVAGMASEPIDTFFRGCAVREHYQDFPNIHVSMVERDMPQSPEEDPENFWSRWHDLIREYVPDQIDYVFASEMYGHKLAEVLGAKFIPVNIDRDVFPISGTSIRENLAVNFTKIIPEMQRSLMQNVTLFGSESCGKTTMARNLSRKWSRWVPEYARGYLDAIGVTHQVTEDHMVDIAMGSFAAYRALNNSAPTLFTHRDTDIFTTVGYWRIFGFPANDKYQTIVRMAEHTPANMYIILDTDCEFVPDHLRYGGGKRTSETEFWVDICNEFGLQYKVVSGPNYELRRQKIETILDGMLSFR